MTQAFAKAYLFEAGGSADEVKRKLASVNPGTMVQAMRAGPAVNAALVEMLAAQTFRAESSGAMLAKKPEIDFLLRFAGTSQIAKAIREQGAVPGKPFFAVTAGRKEIVTPAEYRSAELPRKKLSRSDLTRVERAALLDAQKS
ncbi:MAG: hypothetical protein JRM73_00495 [Nitrososphaerota archaeon]|nr:hypothetical protein [Nitrososphaerota archaeon]